MASSNIVMIGMRKVGSTNEMSHPARNVYLFSYIVELWPHLCMFSAPAYQQPLYQLEVAGLEPQFGFEDTVYEGL